jgi:flagellar motor switch protein FliM
VTSNVEPEEVQAIMDLTEASGESPGAGPVEVSPRNFGTPLRLCAEKLAGIELSVRKALPEAERVLAMALRKPHALELVQAVEVNAEGLFSALDEPFAIVRFEVAGQPGWLVWESQAAAAAVEVALGTAEPSAQEARALSSLERNVMERLLQGLIQAVAAPLGVTPQSFRVVELVDDLGTWRDGGPTADRGRMHLHFAFQGPGEASAFDLYLPGIIPADASASPAGEVALPEHLAGVTVEFAARLGTDHIPLAQLLEIEVGDVIPLGTPVGEPLQVHVEDLPCARAELGSKHGNLAVRITEIGPQDEE